MSSCGFHLSMVLAQLVMEYEMIKVSWDVGLRMAQGKEADIMWISNNWSSGGIGLGYGHALNWNDKKSFGTLLFSF